MPAIETKKKITKVREKIMTDIKNSGKKKYKTTFKDIKSYFNLINETVFENKLSPFNDVKIKNIQPIKGKGIWGQVVIYEWKRKGTRQYSLEMLPSYPTKDEFLNTLGHEMVHLYQMANCGDTGNHNALFYSFQPKLKSIGLGNI